MNKIGFLMKKEAVIMKKNYKLYNPNQWYHLLGIKIKINLYCQCFLFYIQSS